VEDFAKGFAGILHTMIVLSEYDPMWPRQFTDEAERLRPAFGNLFIDLEHIGSTSVPGLVAKPVIDILAIVSDVVGLDARSAHLEALGYQVMGEFGLAGRRYFRKDDFVGIRTHQVHAYAKGSTEIDRHLAFRDYLRAHREVAQAYGVLKQKLVEQCRGDMRCYSDGKHSFIRDVEHRAAILGPPPSPDVMVP
jgi:GrpB-like predicted nucleotidyltransferase (UPF0157 family)